MIKSLQGLRQLGLATVVAAALTAVAAALAALLAALDASLAAEAAGGVLLLQPAKIPAKAKAAAAGAVKRRFICMVGISISHKKAGTVMPTGQH